MKNFDHISRRILKVTVISTIIGAVLIFALHVWFKYNARTVLKEYITQQSKGKIKLELSELYLNLLINRLQIHEADLVSTDSLNQPITYHVTFNKLSLRVTSLWSLLFKKELLLDSLRLQDPVIEVIQWRRDTAQSFVKDDLSIPQEMGKVYRSMLDALDEFGVKRINIDNAVFRLVNKMKPGSEPVTVSRIFLNLERNNRKGKFETKDQTLELKTTQQNIAMPGGRHRLAFKSFQLHLLRQRIELDSCTITKIATDSSRSSYRIFFKKLFLSGVDFNAMSMQNVIKADSVYCENPYFNFDIYKSLTKKKTEIPDAQKIIRELSGNLDLAFVGIKNAGINIDIYGKSKRSFFNSNKDNFEMRGFRINPDSSEPIVIKRFEMTLRDYHLYNEDSSSVFAFDSLNLLNTRIALSNFSIHAESDRRKIRNNVDIRVPYFELTDLDWYQLIFDQNLAATEAVLENPIIDFKRNTKAIRGKKLNLFSALESIDSLVRLNKVAVRNGEVNMQLGTGTSFNLNNLDFNLQSNELLGSSSGKELRRSVEKLSFSKGILRLKDITAQLYNARYSGNNQVYADRVSVTSKSKTIAGSVNNVHIDNLLLDEAEETLEMDGIEWNGASLNLKALPGPDAQKEKSTFHIRNIAGNNTGLSFQSREMNVSTFIETLIAESLLKDQGKFLQVEGFNMAGRDLLVENATLKISGNAYNILNNAPSYLRGMMVQQIKGRDSLYIQSPDITFSTKLNDIFANNFHLTNLHASSPVIKIIQRDTVATKDSGFQPPAIIIDHLTTTQPSIYVAIHKKDSVAVIDIPASEASAVNATGINIGAGGLQLAGIYVNTTAATYTKSTGEVLGIEKGKIDLDISSVSFSKKDGKQKWGGLINRFDIQDASGLQFGYIKSNLKFNQVSLGNLIVSSDHLPDLSKFIKANISAWLRIPAGVYSDSNTTFKWYNASYSNSNQTLLLDSIRYHPTKSLDSVLAHAPYQLDYITAKTGAITISGLSAEKFEKDSSFIADTVMITDPVLTVYRDKLPPSSPNKREKLLPVDMIKAMTLPLAVNTVKVQNGTITYGERNAKSRKEGTLILSGLDGQLENIKNQDLRSNDSLSLTLNGRLMDAYININLKQSYTDTLSGFLLNLKMKPTPVAVFNPVLIPLSNVKLTSGQLDSLSLRAVGRNDIALGEMSMHYHDLRIQLIKDGDANQSTFLQKAISFLANTFLIKNKNTARIGLIYYDRINTQSFVNYILKMTLSGVASSVGAKANRKYMKEYKKALEKSGLPAVK